MAAEHDRHWMRIAIAEARKGQGRTAENPSVGCAIVAGDLLLGLAHTDAGGRPHAESLALQASGSKAMGATAYVTLEPCCHHGKSPPCSQALIAAGVARVVIACIDPDPRVAGGGIAQLRAAGIDVETGVLAGEAQIDLAGFFQRVEQGKPLVTLKMATSLDGRIALANGKSQWITGPLARQHVQGLRAETDAIMTGSGTVLADNARLTCRLSSLEQRGQEQRSLEQRSLEQRSPLRVVLDRRARLTGDEAIFADQDIAQTLWVRRHSSPVAVQENGLEILPWQDEAKLLSQLAARGMKSVLLECGSGLATAFLKLGLIDRLAWYSAPKLMGSDGQAALGALGLDAMGQVTQGAVLERSTLGQDTFQLIELVNKD